MVIAYVLGVPSRFRGAELVRKLQDAKYVIEIIAVDGDVWSVSELKEIYDDAAHRFFRHGRSRTARDVACTTGHREIWRRLASGEAEWGIVFEDDAEITGDLTGVIDEVKRQPGWKPAVIILFDRDNNFNRHLLRSRNKRRPLFTRLVMPPGGAVAYLMNKEAAQIAYLSTSVKRIDFRTDWPHRWPWSIRFWGVSPAVITERANVSTLEEGRLQRRRLETLKSRPARYGELLTGRRWRGYRKRGVPFLVFVYQELYLPLVFSLVVKPRVERASTRGKVADSE
jgi:GR25 family glycosyltransferase involved in LPS biosynthesis